MKRISTENIILTGVLNIVFCFLVVSLGIYTGNIELMLFVLIVFFVLWVFVFLFL